MIVSQGGNAFGLNEPQFGRYLARVANGEDVLVQDVAVGLGAVFRDLSGLDADGAAKLLRDIEAGELAGAPILPQDDDL